MNEGGGATFDNGSVTNKGVRNKIVDKIAVNRIIDDPGVFIIVLGDGKERVNSNDYHLESIVNIFGYGKVDNAGDIVRILDEVSKGEKEGMKVRRRAIWEGRLPGAIEGGPDFFQSEFLKMSCLVDYLLAVQEGRVDQKIVNDIKPESVVGAMELLVERQNGNGIKKFFNEYYACNELLNIVKEEISKDEQNEVEKKG